MMSKALGSKRPKPLYKTGGNNNSNKTKKKKTNNTSNNNKLIESNSNSGLTGVEGTSTGMTGDNNNMVVEMNDDASVITNKVKDCLSSEKAKKEMVNNKDTMSKNGDSTLTGIEGAMVKGNEDSDDGSKFEGSNVKEKDHNNNIHLEIEPSTSRTLIPNLDPGVTLNQTLNRINFPNSGLTGVTPFRVNQSPKSNTKPKPSGNAGVLRQGEPGSGLNDNERILSMNASEATMDNVTSTATEISPNVAVSLEAGNSESSINRVATVGDTEINGTNVNRFTGGVLGVVKPNNNTDITGFGLTGTLIPDLISAVTLNQINIVDSGLTGIPVNGANKARNIGNNPRGSSVSITGVNANNLEVVTSSGATEDGSEGLVNPDNGITNPGTEHSPLRANGMNNKLLRTSGNSVSNARVIEDVTGIGEADSSTDATAATSIVDAETINTQLTVQNTKANNRNVTIPCIVDPKDSITDSTTRTAAPHYGVKGTTPDHYSTRAAMPDKKICSNGVRKNDGDDNCGSAEGGLEVTTGNSTVDGVTNITVDISRLAGSSDNTKLCSNLGRNNIEALQATTSDATTRGSTISCPSVTTEEKECGNRKEVRSKVIASDDSINSGSTTSATLASGITDNTASGASSVETSINVSSCQKETRNNSMEAIMTNKTSDLTISTAKNEVTTAVSTSDENGNNYRLTNVILEANGYSEKNGTQINNDRSISGDTAGLTPDVSVSELTGPPSSTEVTVNAISGSTSETEGNSNNVINVGGNPSAITSTDAANSTNTMRLTTENANNSAATAASTSDECGDNSSATAVILDTTGDSDKGSGTNDNNDSSISGATTELTTEASGTIRPSSLIGTDVKYYE